MLKSVIFFFSEPFYFLWWACWTSPTRIAQPMLMHPLCLGDGKTPKAKTKNTKISFGKFSQFNLKILFNQVLVMGFWSNQDIANSWSCQIFDFFKSTCQRALSNLDRIFNILFLNLTNFLVPLQKTSSSVTTRRWKRRRCGTYDNGRVLHESQTFATSAR